MQRTTLAQRFVFPAAAGVAIVLGMLLIYNAAWRINNEALHQWTAFFAGLGHIVILMGGSLIIYPIAFFRGASLRERVVACLAIPLFWSVTEIIRVTEFFTLGESLYYALNSQFIVYLAAASLQMGLCEIVCRWWVRSSHDAPTKVVPLGAVISILAGAAGVYIVMIWGGGVHWFYLYQQGYKALFL
ncbi:MAG: hypothetical protein HY913_16210 [Desulfomonile tiedjei]|nr:hypothetical protein [Desulfomonile tiedjei]